MSVIMLSSIFTEYKTTIYIYTWCKHAASCRAQEKFKRNTRHSQVFLLHLTLECSTISKVFISQYTDISGHFAFIKYVYFEMWKRSQKISVLWYRHSRCNCSTNQRVCYILDILQYLMPISSSFIFSLTIRYCSNFRWYIHPWFRRTISFTSTVITVIFIIVTKL
jgi:hypothetical protein